MYSHDKNKRLAVYLRQKAGKSEVEQQEDDSLPVINRTEPKRVQVFNVERMEAIAGEHSRNSNLHRNHKRLISLLDDTNGNLPLAELPPTIFDDLDLLRKRFPNFSAVVEFYKQEFALGNLEKNPIFTAQPVLLIGLPGIGKTYFCLELATIINTHFEVISMAAMTAGFVIGGSSSSWAEGKPGKVVQALASGRIANPLLLVDEIDKVGGDKRYDPMGSLYALLEKETAKQFVDESLEIPVDASYVVWVATANYIERIPEPILSRLTVIEVSAPTLEQMSLVLNSIYGKVLETHHWGNLFQEELHQRVIDRIVNSNIEPRMLQKILISACGRAVLRTSANSELSQTRLEITVEDLNIQNTNRQSKFPTTNNGYIKDNDKKTEVVIMPIFNIPVLSSDQNSEETMILWAVYEISDDENKYHHLVGYVQNRQTGRVTSAIKHFDKNTMRLKTESGRVYKLDGEPALKDEMMPVWTEWKNKYNIQNYRDVTYQYCMVH